MKKPAYILNIEKPCTQKWSAMTTVDKGKYCSQCTKTVTDMTGLSDKEIIDIIERSSGSFCGRLRRDQTERTLIASSNPSRTSPLRRMMAALFLLATSSSLSAQASKSATETCQEIQAEKTPLKQHKETNNKKTLLAGYTIENKVVDEITGEPLAFASVVIKGTFIGAMTDKEGRFKLTMPQTINNNEVIIQVSSVGYQKCGFIITPKNVATLKHFSLAPLTDALLGEIVMPTPVKKRWFL